MGFVGVVNRTGQAQGFPGRFHILLLECLEGLSQGLPRLLGDELDVPNDGFGGWSSTPEAMATHGHRVVAHPLQGHAQTQNRGDIPEMVGHRQMPDDEPMAKMIQRPGLTVHDPVVEDDLAGKGRVEVEERLDGVPDLILQKIGDGSNLGPDFVQVPLEAFLVM